MDGNRRGGPATLRAAGPPMRGFIHTSFCVPRLLVQAELDFPDFLIWKGQLRSQSQKAALEDGAITATGCRGLRTAAAVYRSRPLDEVSTCRIKVRRSASDGNDPEWAPQQTVHAVCTTAEFDADDTAFSVAPGHKAYAARYRYRDDRSAPSRWLLNRVPTPRRY